MSMLPKNRRGESRWASLLLSPILVLSILSGPGFASKLNELTLHDEEEISGIIRRMSIEDKIGQMMMVGFIEKENIKELIEHFRIGNVILFDRNIEYQREPGVRVNDDRIAPAVAKLCNELQGFASNTQQNIPLLIAVDQEGGNTIVIEKGVTLFPSNMVIGATRSEEYAFQAGRITGEELRAMGIHMNLAPVVDINQNIRDDIVGVRSYGGDTELVSKLGLQCMNGLHEGGVLSVAKHFPGHGDSPVDPHHGLPKVLYSYELLKRGNLKPFETLVRNGVDAVMPAHMDFSKAFEKVREGVPASLSPEILKGELRDRMGFEGVIISDDMEMRAVLVEDGRQVRTVEEAAVQAVRATSDIIIVTTHVDKAKEVYATLKEEFKDKKLQEKFVDPAVQRILRLKKKISTSLDPDDWIVTPRLAKEIVMKNDNLRIANEIVKEAITLVTDNNDLFSGNSFPFKKVSSENKILIVSPYYKEDSLTKKIRGEHVGDIISIPVRYFPHYYVKKNTEEVERKMDEILQQSRSVGMSIVGITREQHIPIVENLANTTKKPIIVIAFSEPYLLGESLIRKENITYLAAYSHLEPSIAAIVDILFGRVKPKSTKYLPVSLPGITTGKPSEMVAVIPRKEKEPPGEIGPHKVEPAKPARWWFYGLVVLGALLAGLAKSLQEAFGRSKGAVFPTRLGLYLVFSVIWGMVLYLLVVLISSYFPQEGKTLPFLRAICDSLPGAFVIGFVGGWLGPAILDLIPGVKKVSS